MHRVGTTLLLVALLVQSSPGQFAGGYRLFDQQGQRSVRPEDITVTIQDPATLPTKLAPGQKVEILAPLLSATVKRAEAVVRRSPGKDATNIQRAEMQEKNNDELRTAIEPLVGKLVNASMIVEDVVRTEAQVMVVGRFNWQSEVVLMASERKAIADANDEAKQKLAKIQENFKLERQTILDSRVYNQRTGRYERGVDSYAASPKLRELQVRTDAQEKQAKEEIRQKAMAMQKSAEARRPIHMMYTFVTPEKVASWKKGQTRALKAVIQTVGLFVHHGDGWQATPAPRAGQLSGPRSVPTPVVATDPDDTSGSYVATEWVLKMLEEEQPAAAQGTDATSPHTATTSNEPATRPATPDPIAKAIKEKRLETGMTLAQAEEALGSKPQRVSGGGGYETYRWTIQEEGTARTRSRTVVVTARFKEGKLTTYSKS